jgi:tRNA A-37 threonylcarbamoyl transferase component Bud32
MNGQRVHPSPEELSAFGLGQLDDEASAAIESHLAGCADCSGSLESVGEDAFVAKLRTAVQSETAVDPAGHETATLPPSGPSGAVAPASGPPPKLACHPRYRVLEVLGAGGMGTVYKARHELMERDVALKVIRHDLTRDAAAVERFRREVKAAARLAHPNIVTAYDAEHAGGLHFLVMEFVEGTSLDRLVAEEGPLPVARACDYARQAALGLQHAHEKGMVHRDVKPHNLMRTPRGTIKILDFGLARFAQESALAEAAPTQPGAAAAGSLTQVGALMGTPDYLAPEQASDPHAADVRADLYSLGCTLYFLLTGRAPFTAYTGLDKVMAHLERTPEPVTRSRNDIPPGLAEILRRLLDKDPARRYQTPAEAARALEPFTHPVEAAPAEASAPQPPRRGGRLRAVLGGLGGAALLGGLVLLAQAGQEETIRERMTQVYNVCAVLGGTLLVCQLLLSLFGFGHHHDLGGDAGHDLGGHDHGGGHDVEHEAQSSWFVGVLTFRTVVAALVFFGLAGRAASAADLEPGPSLALALAAGAAALFGVAWMMRSLYRLRSDGSVRIERAVGRSGSVYLSVPGHRAGVGKVLLNVQNRTVEYQAVTAHEALPTGTPVTVLAVVGPDTVEVTLATPSPRNTHA